MNKIKQKVQEHVPFRKLLGAIRKDKEKKDSTISKSLKDIIQFATDEVIVRDYHAANVKKPSYGQAHFALTNKRLIWYIWTNETVKVNSINIKDLVSTAVYKTEKAFAIIINIKATTGAFTFSTYPHSILEQGLSPERLELETQPGPDMDSMARELGALIINIHKKLNTNE